MTGERGAANREPRGNKPAGGCPEGQGGHGCDNGTAAGAPAWGHPWPCLGIRRINHPCLLHLSSPFHSSRPHCHQLPPKVGLILHLPLQPLGSQHLQHNPGSSVGLQSKRLPSLITPPPRHHQGVTEMSGLPGVTGAQQQPPSPSLGLLLPLFKVTSG